MVETTQQIVSGVYRLLNRPSELKLHYLDVLAAVNDVFKGYVQDQDLCPRDHRTDVVQITPEPDDVDFRVVVPNVPDFEPVRLTFSPPAASAAGNSRFYEVTLVPYEQFPEHFEADYAAGSFYGSGSMPRGQKLALNMTADEVGRSLFNLSYRMPLVALVQMGDRPPLPSNFLPMAKLEAMFACIPQVKDKSAEWSRWKAENLQFYRDQLDEWKARWDKYLDVSVEPATVPMPAYNDFRKRNGRRGGRPYVPRA